MATPGMCCSGWRTYGTISCRGSLVHPVMHAMGREAPINWRNPRRETESIHSEAPLGNSRCSMSWNSGDPASSSRLRQYSGPFVSVSCRSTSARLSFLLGQTSSRFDLSFSIFVVSALTQSQITARDVLHGTQLVFLHQR